MQKTHTYVESSQLNADTISDCVSVCSLHESERAKIKDDGWIFPDFWLHLTMHNETRISLKTPTYTFIHWRRKSKAALIIEEMSSSSFIKSQLSVIITKTLTQPHNLCCVCLCDAKQLYWTHIDWCIEIERRKKNNDKNTETCYHCVYALGYSKFMINNLYFAAAQTLANSLTHSFAHMVMCSLKQREQEKLICCHFCAWPLTFLRFFFVFHLINTYNVCGLLCYTFLF